MKLAELNTCGSPSRCFAAGTLPKMASYMRPETAYARLMAQIQESSLVMDWTDCPEVETVPGKVSGVPILKHSRMPADAIVQNYRSGLPADEIAEVFELPADGVRRLLAYAVKHNPSLKP